MELTTELRDLSKKLSKQGDEEGFRVVYEAMIRIQALSETNVHFLKKLRTK